MISLQVAMQHTAWADEKLFRCLSALPEDAWRAKAQDDEWHVAALVFHLVASADWYRYQLGGALIFDSEPQSIAEVRALGDTWRELNADLVAECAKDEELMTFIDEDETKTAYRSIILTQAIVHSVEHRAQIAAALKANGFELPDLQDFSVWPFADVYGDQMTKAE